MITSLQLLGFKNFGNETLRVGPLTVIVGTNASGKSNIRDAFRFLHGVGRGYTLAEIIGGKYGAGGQVEWEAIRGAPREIWKTEDGTFALETTVALETGKASYFICVGSEIFGTSGFRIWSEKLRIGNKVVCARRSTGFSVKPDNVSKDLEEYFRLDQPVLHQLHELQPTAGTGTYTAPIIDALKSMRFLDLAPDRMKQPSLPGQTILGDRGENLPTVLKALCDDPAQKQVLTQWTRELTPMDVEDFDFRDDPAGRVHLILQERRGKEISAHSASDGTLRFLAMLAALLGPDPARLYFFEEIDNGIHPSRLNLLIDLIEQQTTKGEIQVIATTHSPQLLSMIGDTTFKNTSVVCRLEDSEDAIVRPVADLPNAKELRKSQGLGRLLAGGWMETALAFTEGNKNDEKDSE